MYVIPRYKTLFIHIPKAGGTTILRSVLYHQTDIIRMQHRHSTLRDLKEPEKYRGYRIFAIARDPYHRFASSFRFNKLRAEQSRPEVLFRYDSFYGFMQFCELNADIIKMGQCEYIDHEFLVPTVFRYESIDKAAEEIAKSLGLSKSTLKKNVRVNYLGDYDYRDWLDKNGVEYINDNFAEDFERFGYQMKTWGELIGQADKTL